MTLRSDIEFEGLASPYRQKDGLLLFEYSLLNISVVKLLKWEEQMDSSHYARHLLVVYF